MGLLVRDGKVVVRDGKAVTTDNPESCECCGGGVDCPCCESPVPNTITGTVTASDCADILVGSDFEMTSDDCHWSGQIGPFECTNGFLTFTLGCLFGNWISDVSGFSSGDFGIPVSTNCSPFELVIDYTVTAAGRCGCVAPNVIRVTYTA